MGAANNSDYRRFIGLLTEARRKAGITQVQLAKALKRPQSFVSKYERLERRLDVIEFLQIAKSIGIDPVSLIRKFRF
ncbi:MAG TPA: helix-turn-helix transcriptional regulator [Rhizomicrobium sp.]